MTMKRIDSMRVSTVWLLGLAAAAVASSADGQVFGPGDPIIAIDRDDAVFSDYPAHEGPENLADQDPTTKYLNFGRSTLFGPSLPGTGFIITPLFGSSVIQAFQLTTANDSEDRDPSSYELYGTNDPITSGDNSLGDAENWSAISSGPLTLPLARQTVGPIVSFANTVSYTSYKMIFPTLRDPEDDNSTQIADLAMFESMAGGANIVAAGDAVLAVSINHGEESLYMADTPPARAIDGTLFRYLNFGGANSGFIVRRADEQSVVVNAFVISTATDLSRGRDPTSYELYGTNDAVTSEDNSFGDQESWTLVSDGPLNLPLARNTAGPPVTFSNSTAYGAYRMVFPTLRNETSAMEIAEVFFDGTLAPPVMDTCSQARQVGTGTIASDLTVFTHTAEASCDASAAGATPDAWYLFTAPCDGTLMLDTFGSRDNAGPDTGPDTTLSLHSDCSGDPASELDCNDDAGATVDSSLTYVMSSTESVRIRISTFSDLAFRIGNGLFELNVAFEPASNSECACASPIGEGTLIDDLTGATGATGDDTSCALDDDIDRWYAYTASADGTITISTCNPGTSYDTTLAVFDACGGVELACNDDADDAPVACDLAGLNRKSLVTVDVSAGTTYFVRISGFNNATGIYELSIAFPPACPCETDGDNAQVDVFDLLAFLDVWFVADGGADIDGAAGVDVFDLLFFLDCWFPASAGAACP